MVPSVNGGDNFVGIGCPDERFGIFVVLIDEAVDGSLKIDDRVEHATFETSFRELGEEALNSVEP